MGCMVQDFTVARRCSTVQLLVLATRLLSLKCSNPLLPPSAMGPGGGGGGDAFPTIVKGVFIFTSFLHLPWGGGGGGYNRYSKPTLINFKF